MVIVYLFASLLGATATIAFLAPYSWLLALLCAPLGGSALAICAAVGVLLRTPHQPQTAALDSVLASLPRFSTDLPDLREAAPPPAAKVQKAA